MTLSFAPYLYRDVMAPVGPIAKIVCAPMDMLGQRLFQANATLEKGLSGKETRCAVYANVDGTGTDVDPQIAQYKATSEALERWAFFENIKNGSSAKYGLAHDRSSNGLAAFPGFAWQARRRARLEALERFSIIGWWDGRLANEHDALGFLNINRVRIDHQQGGDEVVILYRKSSRGAVAYGHAAGSSLKMATAAAAVELARCEIALSAYRAMGGNVTIVDAIEKRCLHYSTPEGHAEFLSRVHERPTKAAPKWQVLFDGEIKGPWTRWAKVWRYSVEMCDYSFLNPKELTFLW